MQVLVTGAGGYIGSVVTEQLVEQGYQVLALDNLVNGHRAAIHPDARFIHADLLDREALWSLLETTRPDAVVHLAAEALIDVSMRDPGLFYRANLVGGLNLLDAMVHAGVKRIVFSSTAATYGEPKEIPITETSALKPVNPYGASKLAFEQAMEWYRLAHGLEYVTLRYFNACGATPSFGEFHVPETHIIPILFQVALGEREVFQLYGTDYETFDGSCIRDYVHVADIAQAHLLALSRMGSLAVRVFNMGNTTGYSNRQVIEAVRRVTGREIRFVAAPRRSGDPARLVAGSDAIRQELHWKPAYPDLESMVETAWDWYKQHPQGYSD